MPFADELLGPPAVAALVQRLTIAAPERSWATVRRSGRATLLGGLGLSERARAVRDALLADGPADYWQFQELIRRALADPAFTGWMLWPVTEAVATLATTAHEAPGPAGLGSGTDLGSGAELGSGFGADLGSGTDLGPGLGSGSGTDLGSGAGLSS